MSSTSAQAWRTVCDAAASNRIWIKGENRRLSFADLLKRCRSIAGFALHRELAFGDRIVLGTSDDEEAALLFAALVLNGLTAVTIDPEAGPDRARSLIGQASAAVILLDET